PGNREFLARFQGFVPGRNQTIAILVEAAAWRPPGNPGGSWREHHNIPVARRNDVPHALQFGESRVFVKMDVLAMRWDRDFWFDPAVKLRHLAAARVSRGVNKRGAVRDDFDARPDKIVDDAPNLPFISGNRSRGKDHLVARVERDHGMIALGH